MPKSKAFRKALKDLDVVSENLQDDLYRTGVDAFGNNYFADLPFLSASQKRSLGM